MSARTTPRDYTIKDAAALTGLPASTLRYYESVGVIAPISRGESSRHRVYDENDLGQLLAIACLAATGMSVSDMKEYVANAQLGAGAAPAQIELLTQRRQQLAVEARQMALRQRYVDLKIDYWRAIDAGDEARATLLAAEASALADDLKNTKKR
ncbi:MerR family transcriptional regulator [Rhodococcus sp. NPDC019627]|uniref:MerR family transcriptional regulator n=1 Tax=Rhodococcus TaxID=1827 RepID=UPI001320047E|nr:MULTISPECIES: MerR family transcriptional regulator [Rhodococcus]MDV7351608.1 MerR family transcriptional regulator [Rhodococcus oxybenzonivorans]QHE69487.1 Transcriptional regulator, MerR family [Rhodococcus sp. WAY2]